MVSLALTEPLWCIPRPSKLTVSFFVAGGFCSEHQACSSACGVQQSDAHPTLNEQIATKCVQPAV